MLHGRTYNQGEQLRSEIGYDQGNRNDNIADQVRRVQKRAAFVNNPAAYVNLATGQKRSGMALRRLLLGS